MVNTNTISHTNLSIRPGTRTASPCLKSVEVIEESGDVVVVDKFGIVRVGGEEGEDGEPVDRATPQYYHVWTVMIEVLVAFRYRKSSRAAS